MIEFEISEELKPIVSEFGYDKKGLIKITFTEVYQNISLHCLFNINNNIQKSLEEFEKRLKSKVEGLSPSYYNLIEEDIFKNLKKIEDLGNNEVDDTNTKNNRIIYQRKYELGLNLYEAVIVDRLPKFVCYNAGTFNLVDKIEVANYSIYPADTIISSNPNPYSFESEQEVSEYFEMAKKETMDSLFEKILAEFRRYLNAEEHTLIILAADTLYSYFQNKFGTTHYNIFVGDSGSGKNSALLVIKMLGYRPFYVTSASPANYYTFLGDIQEGQGIILEDEADDIGNSSDKKNVLKTGYSSGGCVPKVSFSRDGNRYQESYHTFCFKCFAMEELPGDKNNRGMFDRSFLHHLFKGEVPFNIKNIINDKESTLYKNLIHLRKLLLAFKLLNSNIRFPEIKTNLTARDAELTLPLLKIFYGSKNFEKIRKSLSTMIYEKTMKKSNSLESKITETLGILSNSENNTDKNIINFTNEEFENIFKKVAETKDNPFDVIGFTFFLNDGTKVSKYKISNLLRSKFNAMPDRTNKSRGYSVIRADVEKISKQYEVIENIIVYEDSITAKKVTEVTQVTDFKGATTSSSDISSSSNVQDNNNDGEIDKGEHNEINNVTNDDDNDIKSSNNIQNDKPNLYDNNNNNNKNAVDSNYEKYQEPDQNSPHKKLEKKEVLPTTPSNYVTSVTRVTAPLPQYPCFFCGNSYKTRIDFDMELHLVEFHKKQLLRLPVKGGIDRRLEYVIAKTKHKVLENSVEPDDDEEIEDEDRGY